MIRDNSENKGDREKMQVEGNQVDPPDLDRVEMVKKNRSGLNALEGIGKKTVNPLDKNDIQTIEELAIPATRDHVKSSTLITCAGPPSSVTEGGKVLPDQEKNHAFEGEVDAIHLKGEKRHNGKLDFHHDDDGESDGDTGYYHEDAGDAEEPEKHGGDEEFIVNKNLIPKEVVDGRVMGENRFQSPLKAETLSRDEVKRIIKTIESDLKVLDYWILRSDKKQHAALLKDIDLLAVRSFEVSDFVELVILVPIKVSEGRGKHKVYEEEIRYAPTHRKTTLNASDKRLLVDSGLEALKNARDRIFENITEQGVLFRFLSKYANKDLAIERSLLRKELFLMSGQKCHEVITCPVFITDMPVEFLESTMAPFAWQRAVNLHVIEKSRIQELARYLEKKHALIETNAVRKNLIDQYIDFHDRFFSRLSYFSLPFMIYAGVLLLVSFLSPGWLPTFISLGIGIGIAFGIGSSFFVLSLVRVQRSLHERYKTPYSQRPLDIDETGIVLIKEELPEEWMHQFIYEADMNTRQLETVRTIETEGLRTRLDGIHPFLPRDDEEEEDEGDGGNKIKEEPARAGNLFHFRPSLSEKYSKFMED